MRRYVGATEHNRQEDRTLREYFFANYRLLMDDRIANHESSKKRLADFAAPMPYTHTFTLRLGDAKELEERRERALNCPVAYDADIYTIHDIDGGRAFAKPHHS